MAKKWTDYLVHVANPLKWSRAGWFYAAVIGYQIFNAIWGSKDKQETPSPSYSWDHAPNMSASHTIPMPVIYGTARVKPVVKNRFIEQIGDKQYLNVLYSLAGHRIDERIVPNYNENTIYYYGAEVQNPAEPGKTYKLRRSTNVEYRGGALGALTAVHHDYTDDEYWEVGHGTADISSTDIYVNGDPLADFLAGSQNHIEWETRPGLANQTVIDNFDVTFSNRPTSETLYTNYPAFDIKAANIRGAGDITGANWNKFTIAYRGNLYTIDAGYLAMAPSTTRYVIWSPTDPDSLYLTTEFPVGGTWFALAQVHNAATAADSWAKVQMGEPEEADWYELGSPITNAHNIAVYFEFPEGLFGFRDTTRTGYAYVWLLYREVGSEAWVPFKYTLHSDVDSTRDIGYKAGIIHKNTTKPFFVKMMATTPDTPLRPDKSYEVRIAANCLRTVTLTNVAGVTYGDYTYPGEALLGIRALATGELSSDIDVRVTASRSTVQVYDGSSWVDRNANHHAWAVYDILANGNPNHPEFPNTTNAVGEINHSYGCGIAAERIDYASFSAWAAYANDTLGYTLNTVFDDIMTAWEAILRICREGRAAVYPIGSIFHALIDKPDNAAMLFSGGNIARDSFEQHWVDKNAKANSINVTYYNAQRGYEKSEFAIKGRDWEDADTVNKPLDIVLYGTTSYIQAYSIGRYLLNSNELLSHLVSFETDLAGLDAEVGDIIQVQHDQLVGDGGLVISYSGDVLTLDKEVELSAGTTYYLYLMDGLGNLTTRTVTGPTATAAIDFSAEPLDPAPAKGAVWAFGTIGILLYRIIEITASGEGRVSITAMQYDERVYQADYEGSAKEIGHDPSDDMSDDNMDGTEPDLDEPDLDQYNDASNLRLAEIVTRNRITGEYESYISASWDAEEGLDWGEWEVYVRDVDVEDQDWQGEWEDGQEYEEFDRVVHNGLAYISLTDPNTGEPYYIEAP